MCCRVLDIAELGKPAGTDCRHCAEGGGCGIYPDRPVVCREFHCGYLVLPFVDARWFPDDCGMMIFPDAERKQLGVHVDPARADAWLAEPFHADLRRWAVAAEKMGFHVYVAIGRRIVAILPDRDVDLGAFEETDRLAYERTTIDGREVMTARKVGPTG
jgi:hypothetical protein